MSLENKHVVITHHFLAHYRHPIYNLLCRQGLPLPVYSFAAGTKTNIPIKTIDLCNAQLPPGRGGLRWRVLENFWFFRIFLWQTGLIRLALDRKVDVIIYLGVMYHLSTWVSILAAKLTGKRVLMWSHGYLKEEKGLKGWLRERFYRLSDGMLLYGKRSRDLMIRRGFDPDSLYIVFNSLDYDAQCAVRNSLSAELLQGYKNLLPDPQVPTVVYIGRLTASKKIAMLIEAAALLKERGTRVNVLLLGDGPELQLLKDLALHHGMAASIRFHGACYREADIGAFITLSDLCVAPGEVGLTCMHSLVYGTPVITHDNPDFQMPEWEAIVPGVSGDFFQEGSVSDLCRVMENWLSRATPRADVSRACQSVIDSRYNPHYQIKVINQAVQGSPAGQLP